MDVFAAVLVSRAEFDLESEQGEHDEIKKIQAANYKLRSFKLRTIRNKMSKGKRI